MWWSSTMGLRVMPTKLTEHVTMSIHMAPDVASLNNWVDYMEDPTIWMGPWSLPNSGGMPATTLGGLSPHAGTKWSLHKPWRGCWALTAGTCLLWHHLLGWSSLLTCHLGGGCGLWLSLNIGCQEWFSSMSFPVCPAAGCIVFGQGPTNLDGCDLLPNWRAGHLPELLHWWMLSGAPSYVTKAPAHFLPVGKAHLGLVAGLFLPIVGGPLHRQGSSGAMSARSAGCQITYPGGAGISPCLGSGVLVVQCGVVIIYLWCMASHLGYLKGCLPSSLHTPGYHLGQEPPWVLATRLACLAPVLCHLIHLVLLWGEGLGVIEIHWRLSPTPIPGWRCLLSSQELLDVGINRGQALKVLLPWSGPIG